jgi:hypothetical protein
MHTVVTKFCFASVSTVLLAALASCGGGSTASKQHVLHSLRSCLGHLATGVKSPCIGMDVSQLSGISRNELVAALGPPSFCHPTSSTALLTADCAPAKRPVWSFARETLNWSVNPTMTRTVLDSSGSPGSRFPDLCLPRPPQSWL